jgi:fructokinase
VNCALLAEANQGSGVGCSNLIYITIGTGIGAGIMINRQIVSGYSHPEAGHMFLPKLETDVTFSGVCPFHGDRCAEGLASGPSLHSRWGDDVKSLPDDHLAWLIESKYIAMLCINLFVTTLPERIILGGGVMNRQILYKLVREEFKTMLNGYMQFWTSRLDMEHFIVPPALGQLAGVKGGLDLINAPCG